MSPDLTRQLAGHKANLHDPTTSEESKIHSRQEIERLERELGKNGHNGDGHVDSHTRHVLAGYKAALKNPNTSEARSSPLLLPRATDPSLLRPRQEAKAHARQMLIDAGVDPDAPSSPQASSHKHLPGEGSKSHSPEVEHEHRHIGGLKAALNNPNVSEEAKDRAQAELEAAGYEIKAV